MSRRSAWVLILAALTAAMAQSPPTVIRIDVNLVQVDAVVTDSNGNQVADLQAKDFELLQDGKPQVITNFSYNRVAAAATADARQRGPRPTVLKPADVRRTIVVVVDDLTVPFPDLVRVREGLKKFIDEQLQPGDLVAILRTSGGMGALQQFTADRRQLRAAADRIQFRAPGPVNPSFVRLSNDADAEAMQARAELMSVGTLGAIRYIANGLREMPGRKSLILFSESLPLFIPPNNADYDNPLGPEPDFGGSVLGMAGALKNLIEEASRSSVVIYTVNPAGVGSGIMSTALQDNGLVNLARETGGLFLGDGNDVPAILRKAMNDSAGYYLLGYHPDAETFTRHGGHVDYHRIAVRVKRPGLQVRSRSGFFGTPDQNYEPAWALPIGAPAGADSAAWAAPRGELSPQAQLLRALDSPFAGGGIQMRLTPIFTESPEHGPFLNALLYIDGGDLSFTVEKDGSHKAVFDILAVTYGARGENLGTTNRTYTLIAGEESYNVALTEGLLYSFAHPVAKPGAYQFRVALRDARSGKIGSASQFIEVPDVKKGRLVLSSLILTGKTGGADDLKDSAAVRVFRPGAPIEYGYQVLNARAGAGGQPQLETKLTIWRDGQAVFTGVTRKIDAVGPANSKQITAGGNLALERMAPGDYILEVTVTDELAPTKRL